MKPFEKCQGSVAPPRYNDAAGAFLSRPGLESAKQMCAVSPCAGDRVPRGLERSWLAREVMRRDHSAETRRDRIACGEEDAILGRRCDEPQNSASARGEAGRPPSSP